MTRLLIDVAVENGAVAVISQEEDTQFDAVYKNTIKAEYTATAQSYWKGRVTIGYLTTDSSTQQ